MTPTRPLTSSPRSVAGQSTLIRGLVAALTATFAMASAAPAQATAPRSAGSATLVSVDGPARLTVKTKRGKLRIRLFSIDTPQAGECGAAESVAALTKLAKRRGGRFHYDLIERELGGVERDAEGRYLAFLAPPGRDGFFEGLGQDLVDTEWARNGEAIGLTERAADRDFKIGGVGLGAGPPRAPQGVWAKCGGRMHLPAAAPAPAHGPAPWTISADGVTEAIGPLALSPVLSPSTNLTVAQVAAIAAVELIAVDPSECRVSVPSLELVLAASTPGKQRCGDAQVYAVATSGPGAAATTRGVGLGSPAIDAKAAFPRLASSDDPDDPTLRLTGPDAVPWAWQTVAYLDARGKLDGFVATVGPQED